MSDNTPPPYDLPDPVIRTRSRANPSLVWLVPVIAALVGVVLVIRAYTAAGPDITLRFATAEGLEKGMTEVKFRDVVIGRVTDIRLGDNHQGVVVTVSLTSDAAGLAVSDTRFWVVRPRADLGGISGLTTLLSGPYIGVDAGTSTEAQYEFTGLEMPPAITSEQLGQRYTLVADDLGSLGIGSPIYYRRIPVGRITSYELSEDGHSIALQAFVNAPYDRYVTASTRFWNASGVDVSLDAGGLKLSTQSLITLLTGGVAFAEAGNTGAKPAAAGTRFPLHLDERTALAPPDGQAIPVRLRFMQSIRGLAVGAPVDFKGIELGKVTRIGLDFSPAQRRFATEVLVELYPDRLGASYQSFRAAEGRNGSPEALLGRLVERGLRAQLRSGNLLTGQLYVALDFAPKSAPVQVNLARRPLEIPTLASNLDQIQTQIAGLVERLDKLPLEDIGNNLRDTLKSADGLIKQLDSDLAPEAKKTLNDVRQTLDAVNGSLVSPEGPLGQDLQNTLREAERAARSLRNLGDYLQRHPEALLRGKPDAQDPEPAK